MLMAISSLWPLAFLTIAVVDDLCFRKFHNELFIALSVIGFVYIGFFTDLHILQALGGFAAGALLMLPLVLAGVIGAGDLKFMMCFGILMGTMATVNIFIYSLFWGALTGLLQSLLSGKGSELFTNIFGMLVNRIRPATTQKIPYTVAIFFAWMTYQWQGGLL
jgi:Flp pilus assembly protein protease CpaA